MSFEERAQEIRKAVKLVGWFEVRIRIRTSEDRAIFGELIDVLLTGEKAKADEILEEHHIKF